MPKTLKIAKNEISRLILYPLTLSNRFPIDHLVTLMTTHMVLIVSLTIVDVIKTSVWMISGHFETKNCYFGVSQESRHTTRKIKGLELRFVIRANINMTILNILSPNVDLYDLQELRYRYHVIAATSKKGVAILNFLLPK